MVFNNQFLVVTVVDLHCDDDPPDEREKGGWRFNRNLLCSNLEDLITFVSVKLLNGLFSASVCSARRSITYLGKVRRSLLLTEAVHLLLVVRVAVWRKARCCIYSSHIPSPCASAFATSSPSAGTTPLHQSRLVSMRRKLQHRPRPLDIIDAQNKLSTDITWKRDQPGRSGGKNNNNHDSIRTVSACFPRSSLPSAHGRDEVEPVPHCDIRCRISSSEWFDGQSTIP